MRCLRPRSMRSHSARLHDARHDVEGQHALDAGAVAVDVEGDAEVDQGRVGRLLQTPEFALRLRFDDVEQHLGFWARLAIGVEQLVVPAAGVITLKQHSNLNNAAGRGLQLQGYRRQ